MKRLAIVLTLLSAPAYAGAGNDLGACRLADVLTQPLALSDAEKDAYASDRYTVVLAQAPVRLLRFSHNGIVIDYSGKRSAPTLWNLTFPADALPAPMRKPAYYARLFNLKKLPKGDMLTVGCDGWQIILRYHGSHIEKIDLHIHSGVD